MRNKNNRAFTLVELLSVMAIMAIVSLITIGLAGTIGSGRLNAAGNDLMALANSARQEAISKDTMTALIVISSSGNPQWDRRVFCVMELTPGAPGTASTWEPASRWHTLPDGISPDTATDTLSVFSANLNLPTPLPTISYESTSLASSAFEDIVFLPDGRLFSSASTTGNSFVTPPVLRLFNHPVAAQAPGSVNNYYQVTFNSLTGAPIAYRP